MAENAPPALYGVSKPTAPVRFQEHLRTLWEPHEYVRIMNIDDETLYWQALSPQDERSDIDRGPTKITYRNAPRQYAIKPGDSMPLEGWNAYIAVEQLYKKVIAKNANIKGEQQYDNNGKPKERIINWEDSQGWAKYMPRIFLGRETPTFNGQTVVTPVATMETQETPTVSADSVAQNSQSVSDLAKELGIELNS